MILSLEMGDFSGAAINESVPRGEVKIRHKPYFNLNPDGTVRLEQRPYYNLNIDGSVRLDTPSLYTLFKKLSFSQKVLFISGGGVIVVSLVGVTIYTITLFYC